MATKKQISDEVLMQIETQISSESIPYNYDTKEYPVEVIISKYDKDEIFVPHYQRNFVWTQKQKSRFIESVFLGVPIMPFLVSISGGDAELEIVDGSQRIRTIIDYCSNKFKLKGLGKLTALENTKFGDLQRSRQNKFLLRDFRFHVVTDNATAETRADIFNRVNTSSNRLTPSETRKGVYQGSFYDFIIECSNVEMFRTVCPIPEKKMQRGEYEELVLRFFAYSESYLDFKHDVALFLDNYVKHKKNVFEKAAMKDEFEKVISFVHDNFDPPYFARKGRDKATPRVRYEAIAVGVSLALKQNPTLSINNTQWLYSKEFKILTTSDASNNTDKLRSRIEFVRDCLLGVVDSKELSYE